MAEEPDTNTPEGSLAMALREMEYNYTCETMENSLRSIQQAQAWAMISIAQQLQRLNDVLWYGHKSASDILDESMR